MKETFKTLTLAVAFAIATMSVIVSPTYAFEVWVFCSEGGRENCLILEPNWGEESGTIWVGQVDEIWIWE